MWCVLKETSFVCLRDFSATHRVKKVSLSKIAHLVFGEISQEFVRSAQIDFP